MKPRVSYITAAQAKCLDAKLLDVYGISTLVLMENAGRQVADAVQAVYTGRKKIAVACGKGNNGGDGIVAARHLIARGIDPDVFLACRRQELRGEAKINLDILYKLGCKIVEAPRVKPAALNFLRYGLIVDALLGVGLSGPVRGIYGDIIRSINDSGSYVLAVDIPSGLDASTGAAQGYYVKADATITFAARKAGMLKREGRKACGKVVVADLGVPFIGC